ncbi:hypothetical protein CJ014_20830 [Pleomorphomonas carboxyditropha]|uniref:Uncharacterized protein n=2 Tax=Pleomorphomonas carboxyditropha TaxID=2023338 RepID=A0A2G9WSG3_9HYPH|nr:hypothetical protein CJ014_20830 [Pleomorphomonas carboxyditropha]
MSLPILFALMYSANAEDIVLFQARPGILIKDSKYGPVAEFQKGLFGAAAEKCDLDTSKFGRPDHIIGRNVTRLVQAVAACGRFPSLRNTRAETTGAVTATLWQLVAPSVPPPTVVQRAYIMSLGNEATDYTDIEFNLGTTDPGIMTWGPQGATSGQAFQVQRILKIIDRDNKPLIDAAFGSEASEARRFMATRTEKATTKVIAAVMADPARRRIWKEGFVKLGDDRAVRSAYDDLMGASGTAGIPEAIADFYRSYWAHCWQPTEVDYAFFLDRAVQMDVRQAKTDAALNAVAEIQRRLERSLSAAERRRAIAANFQGGNTQMIGDRLARDVAFYIDGIGENELTDQKLIELKVNQSEIPTQLKGELSGWRRRTGQKASDFGFSDARLAPVPAKLSGREPACVR